MANNLTGYMAIGSNTGQPFSNANIDDLIFYTDSSNQSILLGVAQSNNSALKISFSNTSNVVQMNGNLTINGNLNVTGTLTSGGSSDTNMFVGMVAYFSISTIPSGWLACDGQAVSRTTYSALFTRIGTIWGVGDGSTTFNLPDLRGEFIRCFDNGRGIDSGRTFGSLQTGTIQNHTHSGTTSATSVPHTHTIKYDNLYTGSVLDGFVLMPNGAYSGATSSVSDTSHTHTFTTGNPNSGGGTETRPRNIALLACIKF